MNKIDHHQLVIIILALAKEFKPQFFVEVHDLNDWGEASLWCCVDSLSQAIACRDQGNKERAHQLFQEFADSLWNR